jgi:hypothetical protein
MIDKKAIDPATGRIVVGGKPRPYPNGHRSQAKGDTSGRSVLLFFHE